MRTIAMALLVALASTGALAGQGHGAQQPKDPAFQRVAALAGDWSGTAYEGSGTDKVTPAAATYRLTSGGSAVVETLFPGTPHEMVTVYHMDGPDLLLTHYCAAGNQPTLKAAPMTGGATIRFDFVRGSNMKSTDMHMHSAVHTFADADHLRSEWTSWNEGKPAGTVRFEFTRKK